MIAPEQAAIAGVVTIVFTTVARWLRGVSVSGAAAGASVCFVMYVAAGPAAVGALALVFAMTWVSTRFGYSRKKQLGTAESRQGRTAAQVLANLAVAAAGAAIFGLTKKPIFLLAAIAALSEAAADTVSSELGQAQSEKALMITTFEAVPAGTSGGITAIGTSAGLLAAILVSLFAMSTGLLPKDWLGISVLAAALGMITDSLLGATLEKKSLLNNNWVNFLSTLMAAAIAILLGRR